MRVFISWSGEPSRSVARALNDWLESVLPQVDPWMSDEEIGSGARWGDALADSLDKTDFGIVCVTRENQAAPWLIFEAGALAKSVKTARVVPLCIDLLPADITGPLEKFQGRTLDEAGVKRLIDDLDKLTDKPMGKERVDKIFNLAWSVLETAINEAGKGMPPPHEPQRSAEGMLAEVVEAMRRIERFIFNLPTPPEGPTSPGAGVANEGEVVDLVVALRAAVDEAKARRAEAEQELLAARARRAEAQRSLLRPDQDGGNPTAS